MSDLPIVVLKPKKERKVRNFYPWIQRGEVVRVEGEVEDGSLARLVSSAGEFLAVGTYNSQSRFRFRVLSLEEEPIDEAFCALRFRDASLRWPSVVRYHWVRSKAMKEMLGRVLGKQGFLKVRLSQIPLSCKGR